MPPIKKTGTPNFSPDQKRAIDIILNNPGPFFLTGEAGSGKSFVINYLRSTVQGCAVTATTGMAAQLIGGSTLHKWASIHPTLGVVFSMAADTRVQRTSLLIVDEWSMASSKLLSQLWLRFDRAGVAPKVLFVGDFLQLPPVDGEHAFRSDLWNDVTVLRLTTNHRQSDHDFLDALNDMRVGTYSDRVRALIRDRTVGKIPDDCTQLFAHRASVEDLNNERLAQLPGEEAVFVREVTITQKDATNVDFNQFRFPEYLSLKVGARIVMLTNASVWVNGSTGEVVEIGDDIVRVKLDSGPVVYVEESTERIMGPNAEVVATATQFPMMLAWALTIHKAQGMTMDRVGVCLDNHFASGQTYVAASRCRSKAGLFFQGRYSYVPISRAVLKHG